MQATVEGEEMEVEDLVCGRGVSIGRGNGCGSRVELTSLLPF